MKWKLTVLVLFVALSGCQSDSSVSEVNSDELNEWMEGAADSAFAVHPLLPGMMASSFTAHRPDGSTVAFESELLEKPAILLFYRGGWCPYCVRQLSNMRHIDQQLKELGYDLYFISADSPETLAAAPDSLTSTYNLIADNKLDVAKAYGIAYRVDDSTVERYLKGGINLEEASGYDHRLLPAPSVFIIGADGVIHFQYTNPNYRVRLNNDVFLAAAKAAIPSP